LRGTARDLGRGSSFKGEEGGGGQSEARLVPQGTAANMRRLRAASLGPAIGGEVTTRESAMGNKKKGIGLRTSGSVSPGERISRYPQDLVHPSRKGLSNPTEYGELDSRLEKKNEAKTTELQSDPERGKIECEA